MKPLLVGEDNPYGSDPRYALYPYPVRSAGHRLCDKVLGLSLSEYISGFDRVNLCAKKWGAAEARASAGRLIRERVNGEAIVLLGAKVASAFDVEHEPFTSALVEIIMGIGSRIVQLPHPSGRCRVWNEPGAFERARETLRAAGVLLR